MFIAPRAAICVSSSLAINGREMKGNMVRLNCVKTIGQACTRRRFRESPKPEGKNRETHLESGQECDGTSCFSRVYTTLWFSGLLRKSIRLLVVCLPKRYLNRFDPATDAVVNTSLFEKHTLYAYIYVGPSLLLSVCWSFSWSHYKSNQKPTDRPTNRPTNRPTY